MHETSLASLYITWGCLAHDVGKVWLFIYCILGWEEIRAWHARGVAARVSVNFRKISPCIARVRHARAGLTVYPPSSLALFTPRKQKYQNDRKLKVPISVILLRPSIP